LDGLWRSPSGTYVVNAALIESYINGGPVVVQPDGTRIGAGASAPGGWLRVAKEGGKHLTWSAEYTGAGRQLDYNDLGYMQRQNVQTFSASVGWRTLEPGKHTVDTTSNFVAADSRNNDGLDLGQSYELNARLRLLDFSSVFLAADYAPARFDDREVGDGTALERAGYLGGKLEYDSDPRRAVYATLANQTQAIGNGAYATSVQASAVFHALPQMDIELLPQLTFTAGEYRYAWQSVGAFDPYLFGKLDAKNVSVTLRASYTFTPRLTLQAYAQAFLASGHFSNLRSVGSYPSAPGAQQGQPRRPRRIALGRPRHQPRLRRGGHQRQRRLPLGVPPGVAAVSRLHALADPRGGEPDGPGLAGATRLRPRGDDRRAAAQAVVLVGELTVLEEARQR